MAELMTPEEVAAYFRLRRVRTVYEWIAEGVFPNVRCIKRQYRIPKTDVEAYDERCRVATELPKVVLAVKRRVISKGV